MRMAEIQAALWDEMKKRIDYFLDGWEWIPSNKTVITELKEYFTLDDIFACLDEIECYLDYVRKVTENDSNWV
jgi:hypothetical protein